MVIKFQTHKFCIWVFYISEKVQLEATFSGAEYLSYDFTGRGDPIVSDEDEVSLHFKTRLSNSLLFYTGKILNFILNR